MGDIPKFSFSPKDHVELGNNLDILEMEKGVKISGSRSYALKAKTLLERAIMNLVLTTLLNKDNSMSVPVLVNEESMEGTGYFPLEKTKFTLKKKLALVGTSEVSLAVFMVKKFLKIRICP